jgi:hypothetical protein
VRPPLVADPWEYGISRCGTIERSTWTSMLPGP